MSISSNSLYEAVTDVFSIEENAIFPKAISYIPLVGIIPAIFQERSLADKLNNTADVPHLIQLINVKNQYKVAHVVRNLISAALIVTGVALGIINGSVFLGAVLAGLHIAMAGLHLYRIRINNQAVKKLETAGLGSGKILVS